MFLQLSQVFIGIEASTSELPRTHSTLSEQARITGTKQNNIRLRRVGVTN